MSNARVPAGCLLRKQAHFHITSIHSCALCLTQASSPALSPHVLTEVLLQEFQVEHFWFRGWMSIQPGRSLSAGGQGTPADWGLGVGASRVWSCAWQEEGRACYGVPGLPGDGAPAEDTWSLGRGRLCFQLSLGLRGVRTPRLGSGALAPTLIPALTNLTLAKSLQPRVIYKIRTPD